MPIYFLDSSAVIKRYQPELGSEAVARILSEADSLSFISRLTVVEIQRAFARKVREQKISAEELKELRNYFYEDLLQRRFWVRRLQEFHYHSAVRLVRKYAPGQAVPLLRTLDTLQLATALDVRQRPGLDHFVCADKDLCEAAESEQLNVINLALQTKS